MVRDYKNYAINREGASGTLGVSVMVFPPGDLFMRFGEDLVMKEIDAFVEENSL